MKFLVAVLSIFGVSVFSAPQSNFRSRPFTVPEARAALAGDSRRAGLSLPSQLDPLKGLASASLIGDINSASASEISQDSARHHDTDPQDPSNIKLVKYFYENNGDDGYYFEFELSDGQTRWEHGYFKNGVDEKGAPAKILFVEGYYSHIAPDGQTYWVEFKSDENGYRPKFGVGIPPVIPKAQRS